MAEPITIVTTVEIKDPGTNRWTKVPECTSEEVFPDGLADPQATVDQLARLVAQREAGHTDWPVRACSQVVGSTAVYGYAEPRPPADTGRTRKPGSLRRPTTVGEEDLAA